MEQLQLFIEPSTANECLKDRAEMILNSLDITEASRQDYVSRIDIFLEFVKARGFQPDTFLAFKRSLAVRNDYSISTKSKYLTVARVFLKELHIQQIIPVDVTTNVKSFQQDRKHKRFGLSQMEISILLTRLAELKDDPKALRLKAIISLLVYQGLRQIEITRLDVEDLQLQRKIAFIHGKGRDDKEPVDLHPKSIEALQTYMDYCNVRSGALFFSISNNGRNQRLTTKSVRLIVTGFLTATGIRNTTHGFRHYFTTTLIEHFSNDLLTVQKFTRHKSVETLQVYNDHISNKENLPKYYQAFN